MKRRLVSIILTVFLVLSMMPFAAFADNAIVCPACGGSVTKQERRLLIAHDDFYKCDKCGKWAWVNKLGSLSLFSVGDQQILDAADSSAIINFSFNNGHLIPAEKAPTGIGRKDLPGYASDDGTPSVSSDGGIIWQSTWDDVSSSNVRFSTDGIYFNLIKDNQSSSFNILRKNGLADSIVSVWNLDSRPNWSLHVNGLSLEGFYVTAPIKGKYVLLSSACLYSSALDKTLLYKENRSYGNYDVGTSLYVSNQFGSYDYVDSKNSYFHIWLPKFKIVPYNSIDKPTSQTNITINNNVWNGNIYTDNSTNLTYIYPQYTTINENNETVTNISENPIIYNSETKQYYTYDTVTNNYYYITYEQQPATPTPSPSPSPSPAPTETPAPTPSPTPEPSPSPTPGGNGSGGSGGGNNPSGGSSWWEKLLDKLGSALIDGLLGAISTVLKLILKLFSTILGWIIWAVSRVFDLLPFLPPGLGSLLVGGVVVCFVIGIIKFIRG